MHLYLIKEPNRFKVGYTSNYKKRFSSYKTHNLTAKVSGIFKIVDKKCEKAVHYELLKYNYKKCLNSKEWFEGDITNNEVQEMVNKINEYFKTKNNL